MRFLSVGLLLFASTALGQTLTLTVDTQTDPTKVVGLNDADCGRKLALKWTFNGIACEPLRLWVTAASSCKDDPVAGDYELDAVPASNVAAPGTLTRTIDVDKLPVFTGGGDAGTTACADAKVEQTMRVCGVTAVTNGATCGLDVQVGTAPQIRFDTKPPPKPVISEVIARDSALGVTLTAEADSTVVVTATSMPADGGVGVEAARKEVSASTGTAELTGLENGVKYQVIATARDQAGNPGPPSDPSEGTPVKSNGFYEAYVDAGGQETGGCGAAGGGIAGGAVMAALGFWLSRRKQS
jgi:hypothetical protein